MSDIIIKFPASKRKLSLQEEQELRVCINLVHLTYMNKNPHKSDTERKQQSEDIIREFLKRIFEMNEE
jgi:hypothetical protein